MTLLVAITLLLALNGMRGTARFSAAMAAAVTNRPGVLCPTTTTTCSCQEDEPIMQLPLDDEDAQSSRGSLDTRVFLAFSCTRTAETTGQMPNFTTVVGGRMAIREVRLDSLGLRSIGPAAFRPLRAAIPQSLLLNDNLIEHVDVDAFVGVAQTLEELDFSHNQLSQLAFLQAAISGNASDGRVFPNLRKLNLADNRLVSLDGASLGRAAPGLVDLNLSENRLISVEFLVEAALRSLQWLNIGTNRIQRFGRDALLAMPTLFSLMADDNQLLNIGFLEADGTDTSNPAAAVAVHPLEILMIQKNKICTVDGTGLARFHRLSVLDLSQNDLDSVHFLQVATSRGGLTSLKELYIASNRLTTLSRCSIAPLAALTNFDYQNNPMKCGCDVRWLRNLSTPTLMTINHAKCANSPGFLVNQYPEPAQECHSQHDLCPSTDVNETEEQVRSRQKPPSGLSSGAGATLMEGTAVAAAATNVICLLVAKLASYTFGSRCCVR